MFNFNLKRYLMSIITQAVVDAVKKLKVDADNISAEELEQLKPLIAEEVATQVAGLSGEITALKGDLQAIADALTNETLAPGDTVAAVAGIIGVEPAFPEEPQAPAEAAPAPTPAA